jgi:hypothetical protein
LPGTYFCFVPTTDMICVLMSLEGIAVRASSIVFVAALLVAGTSTPDAASQLSPKEIQAEFCNGQPFTSSTPSNTKFTMAVKADGKVTRKPLGKAGVGGEGTWKLSKDGICTTWKGSRENCFTLTTAGEKKWSVMKGKSSVATWGK